MQTNIRKRSKGTNSNLDCKITHPSFPFLFHAALNFIRPFCPTGKSEISGRFINCSNRTVCPGRRVNCFRNEREKNETGGGGGEGEVDRYSINWIWLGSSFFPPFLSSRYSRFFVRCQRSTLRPHLLILARVICLAGRMIDASKTDVPSILWQLVSRWCSIDKIEWWIWRFSGRWGEGRLFFKESFPDHSGCVAKSSFRRMGKNVRLNELWIRRICCRKFVGKIVLWLGKFF